MPMTTIQQWLKTHILDVGLILFVGAVGLYTGLWARVIILDDAMITFRVAENLAHGQGFVYNVGERVQVTTTPLYAIILAGGTWLFGAAPRAALALNICLSALIPVLTYDLGKRLAGRITGVGGALLISLMPLLVIAFSMESYLYVTLILASIDAYAAGRYRLTGFLAGITTLTRGDAVLVGACILTYDFLVHRRLYWRLILPAVGIPAAWYLFATAYYGSPFPATLSAKTAQGAFDWLGEKFLSGFLEYWDDWVEDYSLLFYLFPLLMTLGSIAAVRTEPLWLILIARDVLYVVAFIGLGVAFAEWYYAPLMPGVALLTARGAQSVGDFVARLMRTPRSQAGGQGRTPPPQSPPQGGKKSSLSLWERAGVRATKSTPPQSEAHWNDLSDLEQAGGQGVIPRTLDLQAATSTIVAGAIILLLLNTIYPVTRDIVATNPDWKAKVYPDAARWVAANTSASANLSTIDIGHLGYWSGRQIIDIVGLAQPDVPAAIAEGDFGYAIRQYQPDMILIGALWLPEIQSMPWFQAQYAPRHALKFTAMNEPLVLFTRYDGVKVHAQNIPPSKIEPLDVDFNRQVTLTGYHHSPLNLPGSPIQLTLFWQVEAPIDIDLTVFVQLVDAGGAIVAQGDGKPQQGFYRTIHWQPGEQIIDTYTVPLADDLEPGHYDILLGFYEADTGTRLQILNESGRFKSDHVRLNGVEVQRP